MTKGSRDKQRTPISFLWIETELGVRIFGMRKGGGGRSFLQAFTRWGGGSDEEALVGLPLEPPIGFLQVSGSFLQRRKHSGSFKKKFLSGNRRDEE